MSLAVDRRSPSGWTRWVATRHYRGNSSVCDRVDMEARVLAANLTRHTRALREMTSI